MTQKQSLYIIGDGVAVMIGRSLDPHRYLVRLQEGTPRRLQLLHVEEGAGNITSWIHQVFAESRLRGNWFDLGSGNPVDKIREVIAQWRGEQQHVHDGQPCYFAYVHLSCRHPQCAAAAAEYRARLKDRKQSGDFQDRRFRMNGEQHRPVVPEPAPSEPPDVVSEPAALPAGTDSSSPGEAVTDDSEASDPAAVNNALQQLAMQVLSAVRLCADPFSGVIRPSVYSIKFVSSLAQIPEDQTQALVDMLFAIGAIEKQGDRLVLTGIEPELAADVVSA